MSFYTDILKEQNGGKDVKLTVITGDAGGGASVQQLHPKLIQKRIMDARSKMLSCDMHNMNKALEVGCSDSWGKQGIGHKTPFQMYWLWGKIQQTCRKILGPNGISDAWYASTETLRIDAGWQTDAINACSLAFHDFMNELERLEEGDGNDLALAVKMMTDAPKNIKNPVWTRWESMTPSIALFADYWIVIYIFTRNLAQTEKPSSYLRTLSCALLSLMHNNEMPSNSGIDIERFVKEHEEDDSVLLKKPLNINSTPIFLTVTHFLNGFIKCYFHGEYTIEYFLLLLCSMLILALIC